ncbi:hypothetical protein FND50_21295 [Rhodococcus sp. WB9]|uniref:hypothetical protein n=1 Tax=Rhodococcus sp. WB9 TaxID=2594007 RepID=UPI0011850311|nr:hypothetical protein [Rhodococcus sp. WB9]QDQ93038.1 hypothetical protein FND50_21295 [Rhodococcus sp. WB9]
MTTTDVWNAIGHLADQWRQSALIQRFTEQLPRNNPATEGIPEMLRTIDSTGFVSGQPLIPSSWESLAQHHPLVNVDAAGHEFLVAAQPIGSAAAIQTSWLRSRLPGYPRIPAPQLAPNTYRTTPETGRDFGWLRDFLEARFELDRVPRGTDQLLGIDKRSYNDAIRAVANALQNTLEWTTFVAQASSLTVGARRELAQVRKRLHSRLSRAAVDEYEPERMVRREDFRRQQVASVIDELSESAREYAIAFEKVDELIDWVSLRILGQLVAYGPPILLTDVEEVERKGDTIKFQSNTPFGRSSLVQIDHPLAPDLALVTSMNFYHDERGTEINKFEAEILAGSAGLLDPEPMS